VLPDFDYFIWELDHVKYIRQSQCSMFCEWAGYFAIDGEMDYDNFKEAIDKNTPKVFKQGLLTKELYRKLYGSVVTRCFGFGMPHFCMMPAADFQNHSDKDCNTYDVINTKEHLKHDLHDKTLPNNTYYTKGKF